MCFKGSCATSSKLDTDGGILLFGINGLSGFSNFAASSLAEALFLFVDDLLVCEDFLTTTIIIGL